MKFQSLILLSMIALGSTSIAPALAIPPSPQGLMIATITAGDFFEMGLTTWKSHKNPTDAIYFFTRAIKSNPTYAEAYHARGAVNYELESYQDAISDYNSAIELKPDFADAYHFRVYVRAKLGDEQGAIADLEKAAELYKAQGNTEGYEACLNLLRKVKG